MTGRLVFTVDLDRDVNLPLQGESAAGSMDRGSGTSPRFSSAERGLSILLDILDDVGMKATFFVEGRTSETIDCSCLSGHCIGFHGYDHEDLTGASTGLDMSAEDVMRVMERGYDAVSDNVSRPVCFRAPYMVCNQTILDSLSKLGVGHDSSVYADPSVQPYVTEHGIIEHPVAKGRDPSGKTIAAYLWPMHEGKRRPGDYLDLASRYPDGDLILATHTWHMVERRDSGCMDDLDVAMNADAVRDVLTGIIDMGFSTGTLLDRI